MGLYDRDYMREDEPGYRRAPSRPWSATTWLLVVLGTLFAIQSVAHLNGSFWLETHFALSLDGIRSGKVWQLLTFQFLHGNIVHVAMNGLGLFSLGRFLEQQLGRNRFLLLYFLSGTAGGVLQVAATWLLGQNAFIPVVGASAGISGLLGAFVLTYPDQKLLIFPLPFPIKAWTLLWIVLPVSVIGTVFPFWRIAHAAHLGGLLAGGAFIRWTWLSPRLPSLIPSTPNPAAPPKLSAEPDDTDDFIASEVDPILEKIATHGIHSLTERERKILETARKRMSGK
jgi:membrane associated rhomboid family serine protease